MKSRMWIVSLWLVTAAALLPVGIGESANAQETSAGKPAFGNPVPPPDVQTIQKRNEASAARVAEQPAALPPAANDMLIIRAHLLDVEVGFAEELLIGLRSDKSKVVATEDLNPETNDAAKSIDLKTTTVTDGVIQKLKDASREQARRLSAPVMITRNGQGAEASVSGLDPLATDESAERSFCLQVIPVRKDDSIRVVATASFVGYPLVSGKKLVSDSKSHRFAASCDLRSTDWLCMEFKASDTGKRKGVILIRAESVPVDKSKNQSAIYPSPAAGDRAAAAGVSGPGPGFTVAGTPQQSWPIGTQLPAPFGTSGTAAGTSTSSTRSSKRLVTIEIDDGGILKPGQKVDVMTLVVAPSTDSGPVHAPSVKPVVEGAIVYSVAKVSPRDESGRSRLWLTVAKEDVEKLLIAADCSALRVVPYAPSAGLSSYPTTYREPTPNIATGYAAGATTHVPVTRYQPSPVTQYQPVPATLYRPVPAVPQATKLRPVYQVPPKPVQANSAATVRQPVAIRDGAKERNESQGEINDLIHEVQQLRDLMRSLKSDVGELRDEIRKHSGTETSASSGTHETSAPNSTRIIQVGVNQRKIDVDVRAGETVHVGFPHRVTELQPKGKLARVIAVKPDLIAIEARGKGVEELQVVFDNKQTVTLSLNLEGRSSDSVRTKSVSDQSDVSDQHAVRRDKALADHDRILDVVVGQSRILNSENPVARIAVADPAIADMVQYSPTEVGLIGRSPGQTTVHLWRDGTKTPESVLVTVLWTKRVTGNEAQVAEPLQVQLANAELRKILDTQVKIEAVDSTLMEVLRDLQKQAGINLVIDTPGLEEEGITTSTPVALALEGVTLRSALRILLDPINLDFVIDNEVLKITSKLRAGGRLMAAAYPVADLLKSEESVQKELEELVEVIQSVVEPDSWYEVGGQGSARSNTNTKSIVIRQNEETHQRIAELLSAMRRLKTPQVAAHQRPAAAPVEKKAANQDDPLAEVKGDPANIRVFSEDEIWSLLGVRLAPVARDELGPLSGRYRGGLKISMISQDSQAAKRGLKPGDVLVGLQKWETLKMRDLHYVLERIQQSSETQPVKYYVARGSEILFGSLENIVRR